MAFYNQLFDVNLFVTFVLEFLKVLVSWPVAVAGIAIFCFRNYKEEIRRLIARIRKLPGGIEMDSEDLKELVKDSQKPLAEFIAEIPEGPLKNELDTLLKASVESLDYKFTIAQLKQEVQNANALPVFESLTKPEKENLKWTLYPLVGQIIQARNIQAERDPSALTYQLKYAQIVLDSLLVCEHYVRLRGIHAVREAIQESIDTEYRELQHSTE